MHTDTDNPGEAEGDGAPERRQLSYRDIRRRRRADPRALLISGAGVVWINTVMVTGSLALLIWAGFSQELFFAGERHSEFVFATTLSLVLALWYVHVFVQLLKVRRVEFFADAEGAYILANRSRHDYFFLPWQRVLSHRVSRGYYNGSAAAISLHTNYTAVPEAIVERGSSSGEVENGLAHFSVIPRCFVPSDLADAKLGELRGL